MSGPFNQEPLFPPKHEDNDDDKGSFEGETDSHQNKIKMEDKGGGQPRVNQHYCELCKTPTSGPESLKQHLQGHKHQVHLKLKGMKETGDEIIVEDDKQYYCSVCDCKTTCPENLEAHIHGQKHKLKMEKIGNKDTSPFPAGYRPNLREELVHNVHPLLGLEFLIEFQYKDHTRELFYECSVCSQVLVSGNVISHMMGQKHRLKYVRKYKPELFDEHLRVYGHVSDVKVSSLSEKDKIRRMDMTRKLREVAEIIEKMDGRDKMKLVIVNNNRIPGSSFKDPIISQAELDSMTRSGGRSVIMRSGDGGTRPFPGRPGPNMGDWRDDGPRPRGNRPGGIPGLMDIGPGHIGGRDIGPRPMGRDIGPRPMGRDFGPRFMGDRDIGPGPMRDRDHGPGPMEHMRLMEHPGELGPMGFHDEGMGFMGNRDKGPGPMGNIHDGPGPMGNRDGQMHMENRDFGPGPMGNMDCGPGPIGNRGGGPDHIGNRDGGPGPMGNIDVSPGPMGNRDFGPGPMNNRDGGPSHMGNRDVGPGPMSNRDGGPGPMGNRDGGPGPMGNRDVGPGPMGNRDGGPGPMGNRDGVPGYMGSRDGEPGLMAHGSGEPGPMAHVSGGPRPMGHGSGGLGRIGHGSDVTGPMGHRDVSGLMGYRDGGSLGSRDGGQRPINHRTGELGPMDIRAGGTASIGIRVGGSVSMDNRDGRRDTLGYRTGGITASSAGKPVMRAAGIGNIVTGADGRSSVATAAQRWMGNSNAAPVQQHVATSVVPSYAGYTTASQFALYGSAMTAKVATPTEMSDDTIRKEFEKRFGDRKRSYQPPLPSGPPAKQLCPPLPNAGTSGFTDLPMDSTDKMQNLLNELSTSMINNEDDAAMALQVSNTLTQALLNYRLKSMPGAAELFNS